MIRCKRDMVLKAEDVWRTGIIRRKLFGAIMRGSMGVDHEGTKVKTKVRRQTDRQTTDDRRTDDDI